MRVVNIEVHEIGLGYEDWIVYQLNHFYGPVRRTVYVAHTDDGMVGLGESGVMETEAATSAESRSRQKRRAADRAISIQSRTSSTGGLL